MNLKLLFSSIDLGVVYQDNAGNILDANPAAEKILGYSLEQLRNLSSFSPEWNAIKEDGTEFPGSEHPAMLSLKTGKIITDVIMGIHNPSTRRLSWIKINSYPEFADNDKKPIGVFTSFSDITLVKTFEENVLIFEKALESSTNAIGMSSPEGKHWYQNKAFDDLFGQIGEDPPSTVYVDHNVGREVFQTIISGNEWSGEVEMYDKNKRVLNILLRAYPIKDNTGEIAGLVGVHVDITDRRNMEKRLSESEKRYRTIIERAKDSIFLSDLNGKILEVNDVACKSLGYTKDELEKLHLKDIDVNSSMDDNFQNFWNTLSDETQVTIESIHRRKNGTVFPIEINVGLIELSGKKYILGLARDITDRKKSEEQLRITQFGIDHSQIAIFQINENGVIKYVNEQACSSLGYTKDELLERKIFEIDPNLNKEKWEKHRAETRELGSRTIESLHKRKDGTFLPVEVTINYITFENKRFSFSFAKDITDRKKAEAVIRNSESRLSNAIKIAGLAYWEYDVLLNLYTFNDQFYSLYKTSVEKVGSYQLTHQDYVMKFIHPEDRDIVMSAGSDDFRSNDPHYSHQMEHRIIFGDGSVGYVIVRYNEERDASGNRIKVFGANQDITERKIAEALLKTKEAQLSKAMQIAKLGYWEMDWQTNTFIFNDQFYSIYKTNVDEVGGYEISLEKYTNLFIHPDDVNNVITGDHKTFETEEKYFTHKIEHRMFYGNGDVGYVAVRYYLEHDENGNLVKTIGVNQDITEQKIIEMDLLAAKEKAEENDRFKTAFLNNMSHEIRTPLNVIVGYSGLIKDGNLNLDELKSLTEPILRSAGQLQKIIEDILDISRIETGQLTVSHEEININEIIEEVIEEQRLSAENKKLMITFSHGLRKNSCVFKTDSSKLKQILVNLVSNAIKYTKTGSVEVNVKVRKKDLLFEVKDTGSGIEEKYYEIVFERFQRLDNLLSKEDYHSTTEGGTGLGLPICRGLVELLGGKIWLESQPGIGTSFYFTIPRA